MATRAEQLANRANERLAKIGGIVPAGSFVCPMCLRSLPIAKASEGHFPARSVRAKVRRVELQCADCNSGIGGSYEQAGADFMEHVRTITMARPGGRGSKLQTRAKLRNDEELDAIGMHILTSKRPAARRRAGRTRGRLDHVLAGMPTPRAIAVSVKAHTDEVGKRALVAWSFLELFRYAGYKYAASPGAAVARRLILDPHLPLPTGIAFQKGSVELPLGAPEPVVIVRRGDEAEVIQEAIALGVLWGALVVVFPFGSDEDDRAWVRIAELMAEDQLLTTRVVSLRPLHAEHGEELVGNIELVDEEVRRTVTAELRTEETQGLADGRSPFRLDPPKGHGWRPTLTTEHEFITVEGDPPPLRTEHWDQRVLAMGGGYLPEIVAKVLEEIPTVPRPVPSPAPLLMVKTADGWRATLRMEPDDITGEGPSPRVAVAVLLATVERDLAIESIVVAAAAAPLRSQA